MQPSEILNKCAVELQLRGASQKTIKTYLFFINKFFEFVKKNPVETEIETKINSEDARAFLAYLINQKQISIKSMALAKAALRYLYEDVLKKQVDLPKKIQIPKSLPVVLTKEEILKLLNTVENPKHKLLLELLYSTGLRVSEITNLKAKDFEIENGVGWVRSGKGAKDRFFIIPEKLKSTLAETLKNLAPADYLF
ncbi:MAG: tyrosine-type recombinase/integrase, partial [Candidatus Nanoarchaeia archaeon]